jgi:oligopeptide/dipeptide ABC transporter ATP-binding protein
LTAASPPLLRVEDLVKAFPGRRSLADALRGTPAMPVRAVDGISFELRPGEILALVGESGCGKTTTGNLLMGLERPTSGRVVLNGEEVGRLSRGDLRRIRRQAQMVFQDPYESLNPRMTVAEIVAEPLRVHGVATSDAGARVRVAAALGAAGLTPVEAYLRRYPWELSGGQRQRVVIAAALALEPALLIADEPVSMLDVSIRAEILNLLAALAHERGIGVVMITHDLSTVAAYADRIAVMYLGRIVEQGPTRQVLHDPRHPYAQALLSVVPVPDPQLRRPPVILRGETPDASRMPSGCRFHPRCPKAFDRCPVVDPALVMVDGTHAAACLLPEAGGGGAEPTPSG